MVVKLLGDQSTTVRNKQNCFGYFKLAEIGEGETNQKKGGQNEENRNLNSSVCYFQPYSRY